MKFSILSSVVLLVTVNFVISSSLQQSAKIQGNVLTELAESTTIDILVTFKTGTAHALESVHSLEDDPLTYDMNYRHTHIQQLVSTLKQNADETQKNAIQFLTDFRRQTTTSYKIQSFWITNQLFIEGADEELITKLSQMDDIESIDVNEIFLLDPPITTTVKSNSHFAEDPWGIRNIKVPQAWALNGGNKGEGTIVATIDSGVRGTHVALRDNFLGTYGWYDPVTKSADPYDNEGHGTHVTGTIVGREGIGVAPNAKWMACKGCPTDRCPYSDLVTCAEFVTCPHLTTGPDASANCGKAPHVVSNSWGGVGGSTLYVRVINAWHVAGIIPVFSNGNSGEQGCNTAGSPGDNARVIGVGSTTEQNGLSVFSSRGPSAFDTIKPDISAPGHFVLSASHASDSTYVVKSGTSMACPHVAGVIALMKSAVPHLSYDLTKSYLFNHTDTDLTFETGRTCGGMNDSTFPNHFFGHGKVNALKTMEKLLIDKPYIPTTTTTTTTTIKPTTDTNTSNILQSCSGLILILLLTYGLI